MGRDEPRFASVADALDHIDAALDFIRHEVRHGQELSPGATVEDAFDRADSFIDALNAAYATLRDLRELCGRFSTGRARQRILKRRRREPL